MRITVLPGLTLDGSLFGIAAEGLATYAPDLAPLTWRQFVDPGRWLNIPNDHGELSKSELTLTNTAEQTVRLNVWHRADLRGGATPLPHNHPWTSFTGHVLTGGYDEDRWVVDPDGGVRAQRHIEHIGPTANVVDHDVFHEVTAIHEPGRTLSLMVCERGRRGDWSHLDIETGALIDGQPVPGFEAMLRALNPHRYG